MDWIQVMYNDELPDDQDCNGQQSEPCGEASGSSLSDDYSMTPEIADAIRLHREQTAETLSLLGESGPLITRLIVRGLWAEYRRQSGMSDSAGQESGCEE